MIEKKNMSDEQDMKMRIKLSDLFPLLGGHFDILPKQKFGNIRRNHYANPVIDSEGNVYGGLTSSWANDWVTQAAEDGPKNDFHFDSHISFSGYKKPASKLLQKFGEDHIRDALKLLNKNK